MRDRGGRARAGGVRRACDALARALRQSAPRRDELMVRFWANGGGAQEAHARRRRLDAPEWAAIARNYPPAVRQGLGRLVRARRPGRGTVLLWHGAPGTGKTHALRALARAWRGWCALHYVTDPDSFLTGTDYLMSVATASPDEGEPAWRLIVLEDAGELMGASARADTGQGLSRILNLTDGLLGQGQRCLLLVTTNEPVGRLHPALRRPGRCWAEVEFAPFSAREAAAWLRRHGAPPARARGRDAGRALRAGRGPRAGRAAARGLRVRAGGRALVTCCPAVVFYEPHLRDRSLLPHDPFKAAIAPRPIGWVSTLSADGAVNLAPYSFFNAVCGAPPMIAFSSEGMKDSAAFAIETREFVWNMPTWDLREAMNATSASLARGENEFDHAGLEMAPSRMVAPPRVAATPCALECKVTNTVNLSDVHGNDTDRHLVVGQVVGVHLDERYIRDDGILDVAAMRPIARCGYTADYSVLDRLFQMERPR